MKVCRRAAQLPLSGRCRSPLVLDASGERRPPPGRLRRRGIEDVESVAFGLLLMGTLNQRSPEQLTGHSRPGYPTHAIPVMTKILEDQEMGRGILLWLLGVPIPIIILLALLWH